jgi:tRNA (guanine-N7-)-methyltransferase
MLEPTLDLKPWFTVLKDHSSPVKWEDVFPQDQPIEIDVGCGRGLFMWNSSQKQPHKNFLGIEIDMKEGRRGALRLKKIEQPNARVWGGDVKLAFEKYVPAGTISAVHLYFPDPWWKSRHHKRRVFNEQFLAQVEQVLMPSGEFHLWTDVTEYWRNAATTVRGHARFEELPAPAENKPEHEMDYQTSYEKKKRRDGWPIYRGRWKKK